MKSTQIKIDHLNIRCKNISPHSARSLLNGLGHELMEQLAQHPERLKERRTVHISKIDSGNFLISKGTGTSTLQRSIADRIADSIASKIM